MTNAPKTLQTAKKTCAALALSLATIAGVSAATTQTAAANEAVAGVVGFVAGAIVGSAVTQAHQPRVVHVQPRAVVVHSSGGAYAPWTPAWYSSCSQRYRSFNPSTGYYLAYSGQYHFCR